MSGMGQPGALLAPERVRELLGPECYPEPKPEDKRVTASRKKADRVAELISRLGSVRAAARRLRMKEKSVRNLLGNHGYSVARLLGKGAA